MNIFIKIKNSIYGPKYYGEVLERTFGYSLKYYLMFGLLFALAFAVVATVRFAPEQKFIVQQIAMAPARFPQDLVINVKDGKASSNVKTEPYFIKIPDDLKSWFAQKSSLNTNPNLNNIDNALVIDTKDKFDVNVFMSYKTLVLLTADSVVYVGKNNQITISSLDSVKDFTLDKTAVENFIGKIKPYEIYIFPAVSVGTFVIGFFIIIFELVYLLFAALLVWLIAKIKGMKIGYGKSFQTGMHLITLPIIITSLLSAFFPNFAFPFLFTILLVLSASVNLKKAI